MRPPLLRSVALVLLVALAPLALDGCVSIGVSRADLPAPPEPGAPPRGAVTVAIYEKPADREADRHVAFPVLSELLREGKGETLVARSMNPTWTVPDLPPGRYRLRVTKRIDDKGNVVALDNPGDTAFDVTAGERTVVSVVLRKVPVFWIVVAALTVVALIVLAIVGVDRGVLPKPPPLPPIPPVAVMIPLGAGAEGAGAPAVPAPSAVDVFPAPGSVVAAKRVSVTFLLSMPLAENGVEGGAVLAVGTTSGDLPGQTSYLPEEQLLRFAPSQDFAPGEDVTITLDLSKLRGEAGRKGSGLFSTTFKIAR
jgi:hypothetical protein